MNLKQLSEPFPPEFIKWRVGSTNKDKTQGMALAYADARAFMDRLDEICGPANWQDEYFDSPSGRVFCKVGIKCGDEWVWKADGAGSTDIEGDKGGISDAFKRACVKWGLGRYLYDLKSPWVEIQKRGSSYVIAQGAYGQLNALLGPNQEPKPKPAKPQPKKETAVSDEQRKPSEAMLKKLWASGNAFYGAEWESKRAELVTAVTKGRTDSSKHLTFDECKKLIDGIEKLANEPELFDEA